MKIRPIKESLCDAAPAESMLRGKGATVSQKIARNAETGASAPY